MSSMGAHRNRLYLFRPIANVASVVGIGVSAIQRFWHCRASVLSMYRSGPCTSWGMRYGWWSPREMASLHDSTPGPCSSNPSRYYSNSTHLVVNEAKELDQAGIRVGLCHCLRSCCLHCDGWFPPRETPPSQWRRRSPEGAPFMGHAWKNQDRPVTEAPSTVRPSSSSSCHVPPLPCSTCTILPEVPSEPAVAVAPLLSVPTTVAP